MAAKGTPDEDEVLYRVLLAFLLLLAVFFVLIRLLHLEQLVQKPCLFYRLTGWYCPGCGGTRACRALLSGRLADSFRLHPLVPYMAGFLVVFLGSHTLAHLSGGKIRGLHYRNRYLAAGALILAANWIIKNYYLIQQGIDLLKQAG